MGTREGDEADIESLVKHSTEGNRLHEYFMGFGCILPHIHNMIVLLDFFSSLECNSQKYFKYTVAHCAVVFYKRLQSRRSDHTDADKCRAITMAISDCL